MTEHFSGTGGPRDGAGAPGPLGAEALRLMSSVSDWAQDRAQDWAGRNRGHAGDGHPGNDCQWCPLCQFLAVLRGERPDVTERVAEAGSALAAAMRALVEAASGAGGMAGHHREAGPQGSPRVQKINLNDED